VDLRSLSSASQGKKVVLLSNPNCPTGHLYSVHELERIANHSKLLIVDEVFLPLFSGGRFSQIHSNSKIVGIGSLSKSLGLSHLRLGWLFGPSKFIANANVLAFHFHTDMPNWSLVGGIQALKESKSILAKLEKMANRNRDFVKSFVQSRPGLISHNFETGYFGTYKVPKSFRSAEMFAETLLKDKKIWVRPCTEFGLKKEVRFHLLTSQKEFRRAFTAMVTT
jgi:aspartate/methionine/tyrosine aminotransferase